MSFILKECRKKLEEVFDVDIFCDISPAGLMKYFDENKNKIENIIILKRNSDKPEKEIITDSIEILTSDEQKLYEKCKELDKKEENITLSSIGRSLNWSLEKTRKYLIHLKMLNLLTREKGYDPDDKRLSRYILKKETKYPWKKLEYPIITGMNPKERKCLVFFEELKSFYMNYANCTASCIRKLADIQKKYPELYKKFKETIKISDEHIFEFCNEFPEEMRDEILIMFLKLSFVGKKCVKLFDLTPIEQTKVADMLERIYRRFMKDRLLLPACEKCGFETFVKTEREIPLGDRKAKAECFVCGRCDEIYFTEEQSKDFLDKINKEGK